MWQFLGSLVSGFLLLRDVFGYIIPGMIFAALASVRLVPFFEESSHARYLAPLKALPLWLNLILALIATYVIGQFLAAIGYSVYGVVDRLRGRKSGERRTHEAAKAWAEEEKKKRIAGIQKRLYSWYLYPPMFTEADRRGTINILRVGLAVGLAAGAGFLLPESRGLFIVLLAAGFFMLWNGYTGIKHIEEYTAATLNAAEEACKNHVPFFTWSPAGGQDQASGDSAQQQKGATTHS